MGVAVFLKSGFEHCPPAVQTYANGCNGDLQNISDLTIILLFKIIQNERLTIFRLEISQSFIHERAKLRNVRFPVRRLARERMRKYGIRIKRKDGLSRPLAKRADELVMGDTIEP